MTACTPRSRRPDSGALGAGRGGKESALARSLAKLGVGPDDIAVISKHDTSTLANDPNETELHERLADALGRSAGAPLLIVSQKSLTGHAKGGAAVFQMVGMCQMMRDGVIPPNRSLDCVDDELAASAHFVWVRDTLRLGGKFPLKAGLVTSLGFGHVSGLIALVHPQAFLAALGPEQRAEYQRRADARLSGRPAQAGLGDRRRPAALPAARRPSVRARRSREAPGSADAARPGVQARRRRFVPAVAFRHGDNGAGLPKDSATDGRHRSSHAALQGRSDAWPQFGRWNDRVDRTHPASPVYGVYGFELVCHLAELV